MHKDNKQAKTATVFHDEFMIKLGAIYFSQHVKIKTFMTSKVMF